MERGEAAAALEDWAPAIRFFEEAQKSAPFNPKILFNLALARSKAGHELPAIAWFNAYLAAAPDADPAERAQVAQGIHELESKLRKRIMEIFQSAKSLAENLQIGIHRSSDGTVNHSYDTFKEALLIHIDQSRETSENWYYSPAAYATRAAAMGDTFRAGPREWSEAARSVSGNRWNTDFFTLLARANEGNPEGVPEQLRSLAMNVARDLRRVMALEKNIVEEPSAVALEKTGLTGIRVVGTASDPASGLPMRIRHDVTGIELVLVPAGEFEMGNNISWSKPIHTVYLDAYYIGVTEVTNAQFLKFRPGHNSGDDEGQSLSGDNQPVASVSWDNAKAWCDWAGMSLPTEAQWEKAARGTDGRKYPWGNEWPPPRGAGNFSIDGYDGGYTVTSPVGLFGSSEPYGTRDMAGNVREWCADWYGAYPSETQRNPTGAASGTFRVLRGACWRVGHSTLLNTSNRAYISPDTRSPDHGFRPALSIPQDK